VLNRPVEFFARILPGHSRALGSVATFLIAIIVVGGVVTLIVPIFFEQSINFAKSLPDTISSLQEQSDALGGLMRENGLEETFNDAMNDLSDQANHMATQLGSWSVSFVAGLVNGVGIAMMLLVLTFFMLLEGPQWLDLFWKNIYKDKKKMTKHQAVAEKMYTVVSDFATSQVIISAICGVMAGLGVFVLSMCFGIPSSLILPISTAVFVTALIPMFGPFIGGAIGTVLILLYSPIAALIFLIYLVFYELILYNIFTPKITSRAMKISALVVLVSLIVGLQIAGILGAILAIPAAGCVVVLGREFFKDRAGKKPNNVDIDVDIKEIPAK
jgi:predicted PurR-regulated permease PerM